LVGLGVAGHFERMLWTGQQSSYHSLASAFCL
jgi:hypothetical protein